jgi:hypothetical protein
MGTVDPSLIGGLAAVVLGLMLVLCGVYFQRGGRLQHQQGAEGFALFGIVVGVFTTGAGVLYVLAGV